MSLFYMLVLLLIVVGFGVLMLFLTSLAGPKLPASAAKRMPYECGTVGVEKSDTKISVRFYLVAILFILFDIEVIFLFPWALIYRDFLSQGAGAFMLLEMSLFMLILIFGLFYVWKGRALEWE